MRQYLWKYWFWCWFFWYSYADVMSFECWFILCWCVLVSLCWTCMFSSIPDTEDLQFLIWIILEIYHRWHVYENFGCNLCNAHLFLFINMFLGYIYIYLYIQLIFISLSIYFQICLLFIVLYVCNFRHTFKSFI